MSFPKYEAYKDSGVEWLGEVPEHWDIHSLKRSVEGCINGIWGNEPDEIHSIPVIRVADFDREATRVSLDKLTYRSILPKDRESRLLQSGDLLIEKSGGGEKTLVGCVVLFEHELDAVTSNFVARMRPIPKFDSNFLCYVFNALYQNKVNYPSIKQTTGIQNLDSEAYLQEYFSFPTLQEQIQIAHFLDHETARIDALITQQQRLIELLKEKRQAVISHAVTKGLDPTAPMKDSGVEWRGEVPDHWGVSRVGWQCFVGNGCTPSRENLD
ncbi:MAG: restriction endonuclease subunit S, partial [Nodosilinea sp.]